MASKSVHPHSNFATGGLVQSLGLAVLAAFLIALAEITVRLLTSPEQFSPTAICLALTLNIAMLGALAILLRLCLVGCRSAAHALTGFDLPRANSWAATALVIVILLVASENFGLASGIFSAFALLASAAMAVCLAAALPQLCRWRIIHTATLAGWVLSVIAASFAIAGTVRELDPWLRPAVQSSSQDSRQPNVLLIVLDTLRFDRVGATGGSTLTPNLDRFAENAVVYTQAISTAPWTLPMHASLFTGLYPREHGVSWGRYALDDQHRVVAELFKDQGYDTVGISNNWLVNDANGFARGFDEFLDIPNRPRAKRWRLAARASLPRRTLEMLGIDPTVGVDAGSALTNFILARRLAAQKHSNKPFFAFVNYFEPHDPYHPPEPFLSRHLSPVQRAAYKSFHQRQDDLCAHACGRRDTFTPEQIELMSVLYDAEVAYQDYMLGRLLDGLEQEASLENTWVIITSDHGELFGEAGMVFHTAGAHFQLLHVPLMVRPPGGTLKSLVHAPVQPVDIFHKLVEICGAQLPSAVTRAHPLPMSNQIPTDRKLCVSESFGASITGLYVTQYRSLQTDVTQWLHWVTSVYADGLLLELDDRGPQRLFDVVADPRMEDNLIDVRREKAEEYEMLFRKWISGEIGHASTSTAQDASHP